MNESTQNTQDTIKEEDNSDFSFDNTTNMDGVPDNDPNVYHGDGNSFGNIPPIQNGNLSDSVNELGEAAYNFPVYEDQGPALALSDLVGNSQGNSQDNSQDNSVPYQEMNNTFNVNELTGTYQGDTTRETLPSLQSTSVSSFGNSVNSGTDSFGGSRITFGGKKVKKTALDELIKDMNRITYILKGMKVERKVMTKKSKKSKKNKNKTRSKINKKG